MIGPISRIIGRVVAGALIGAGLVSQDHVAGLDADVAEVVGVALWGAVEMKYIIAKRLGWKT